MSSLFCDDVLQFQETLKAMRDLDDKIVYSLNTSIPTESIKTRDSSNPSKNCEELYGNLKNAFVEREKVINKCITITSDQVKLLKKKREEDINNIALEKKFKSEQRKLRVLKQEQGVEEIIGQRTLKIFNEKCRNYWKHVDSF